MANINLITEIIYEHIGGATDDPTKSKGVYQFAKKIAEDLVAKVPQLHGKVLDRTNTNPRFDRYRTFPEFDAVQRRQELEQWLACFQQGESPVERIIWGTKNHS
jgi:hypothetical protein